jgi:hypothetical protein
VPDKVTTFSSSRQLAAQNINMRCAPDARTQACRNRRVCECQGINNETVKGQAAWSAMSDQAGCKIRHRQSQEMNITLPINALELNATSGETSNTFSIL